MQFPTKAGIVAMMDAQFILTDKSVICMMLKNEMCYKKTRYIVLRRGAEFAVVRVTKTKPKPTKHFCKITGVDVLSLPCETVFVREHLVDVLNPNSMYAVWLRNVKKFPEMHCLIVKGRCEHLSFIINPIATEMLVCGTSPPFPRKLDYLIGEAVRANLVKSIIIPLTNITEMTDLVRKARCRNVVLPCKLEKPIMVCGKDISYLNVRPELPKGFVTLIGCELTRKIFHELYDNDIEFINICPLADSAPDKKYKIALCCKVKCGCWFTGKTILVPCDTNALEVARAINYYLPRY